MVHPPEFDNATSINLDLYQSDSLVTTVTNFAWLILPFSLTHQLLCIMRLIHSDKVASLRVVIPEGVSQEQRNAYKIRCRLAFGSTSIQFRVGF
jgi:hypothetical protein